MALTERVPTFAHCPSSACLGRRESCGHFSLLSGPVSSHLGEGFDLGGLLKIYSEARLTNKVNLANTVFPKNSVFKSLIS